MVGFGRLVIATALLGALAACGESTTTPSSSGTSVGNAGADLGTATVKVNALDGLKFDPAQQTARIGDIIEWDNTGSVTHTVTFDSQQSLSDASLNPQGKWQVRFSAAGTYQYHCTIHAGMSGSITVS